MCDLVVGRNFEPMPRPRVTNVRKAVATFPQFTAVGCSEWEPWTWKHLSDSAIVALTDIGMAMEILSLHPQQCKLDILKLLPKPTRGLRAIGILPTLLRACARFDVIRCWQLSNARDYFWSEAGRGSEKAVWWESLRRVLCAARYAGGDLLLDLFECFERVHVIAFRSALRLQFPPLLLKWFFQAFRHARVTQWQGAVSDAAETARGIVAGCGAATAMLRVVLIPTLAEFSAHYASMGLKVHADDIACRYESPELETMLFPKMAVDQLLSDLSAHSDLRVRWDKFLVVSTHVKLAKRFAQYWAERCQGVSRGCVAGRGPECPATRWKSQAEGKAQIADSSSQEVEAMACAGSKPFRIMSGGAGQHEEWCQWSGAGTRG